MTRIIAVTSGKGGVGKTTLTSNLGYALTELGHDVTLMDTNLTTPNLGMHLGMYMTSKNLHKVLKGKIKMRDATYIHPFGFKVIPSSINLEDLTGVDPANLKTSLLSLVGQTDFVILDSAAGLGRESLSSINAADEILIITNPDLPSVVDALRATQIARGQNKKILGVVINRKTNKSHELTAKEIENVLSIPVLVEIPEDKTVHQSIAAKKPLLEYEPNSPAAFEIRRLAYYLAGRDFPFERTQIKQRFPFLSRLIDWMLK